jgi:hypothetical protein
VHQPAGEAVDLLGERVVGDGDGVAVAELFTRRGIFTSS